MGATTRRRWAPWFWWIVISVPAWCIGTIVLLAVGSSAQIIWLILGLALFGAIVGLAQWLILQRHMERTGSWVPATTVGIVLGGAAAGLMLLLAAFLLDLAIGDSAARTESWIGALGISVAGTLSGAAFGGVVGMIQSMVLPWHVQETGWWVLASIIGAVLDGVAIGNIIWVLLGGAGSAVLHPAQVLFMAMGLAVATALGGPFKAMLTGYVLSQQL